MSDPHPEKLAHELRRRIRGDVYVDQVMLGLYATDASNYQIMPVAVVVPRDDEDVVQAVTAAAEHGVSILPRGGGTSLAGQTVGTSLVLDFSKYMNGILEVNTEERWARVQPGLVRDELNHALASHGLHFAPDPATADRANIGGMIGTNSSGMRSILYGKTVDHVLETRVLLADGNQFLFKSLPPEACDRIASTPGREAEIYRRFREMIDQNRDEIERTFPKVMRRVGGYNLDLCAAAENLNLSHLMVGSEGTLATVLEAKVNLEPLPRATALCVAHFDDLLEAIRAVETIVEQEPTAVEILDSTVLQLARQNLATAPLCQFLEGEPDAILIIEFYGADRSEAQGRAAALANLLQQQSFGYAWPVFDDPQRQTEVWKVRKSGLGLMLGMKGSRKPLPFIEDACVPVSALSDYIEQILTLCRERDTKVALYAHASVGVIHVRPILDLRRTNDIERMKTISARAFTLVKKYGGSWSGEHGDGLVRSAYLEAFYGPTLYNAFKEVKRLFDPEGLMNPGKIVDPEPIDEHLRFGPGYHATPPETQYRYREEQGFVEAVHLCTGVGACRKTLSGTMCPSYMATRDEQHTTRGRANALRLAMSGQLGKDGMTSRGLFDVLDLCLSCKGCKAECPSNVDMAKLKSEFLQGYHDRHGITLRDRMIAGAQDMAARMSGPFAPLVNAVQRTRVFRHLMDFSVGIDRRRTLPPYARRPLVAQLGERDSRTNADAKKVVLFDDCYLNYYEPHIGHAAIALLESCGYEVELARAGCCQRSRISHGFLRDAKQAGAQTMKALDTYVREGYPVLVCEPSCASALTDDLPDLLFDELLGRRVAANVMMIDMFLNREHQAGRLDATFTSPHRKALIHGHCHQKALYGTAAMKRLLAQVPGLTVTEVDSGCCGMAGAFGYEKEHYDLSQRIGERRLFPAARALKPDTALIACGFSCRHQIADATGTHAAHWVETLRATPTTKKDD